MYIALCDMKVLQSNEVFRLCDEYEKKFGEQFIHFNYADFQGTKEKCAAQIYLETLRAAVEADKPYNIISRRYDVFDH